MGAPGQAPASGSGVTTQRSLLPDDIVNQGQDAFRNTLNQAMNTSSNLANGAPTMGQIGSFNPSALNLQNSVNLQKNFGIQTKDNAYDFGPTFSKNLDPLVQAQLSKAIGDSADVANAQNQRISQQLGGNPANASLIASLQAENNRQSAMSAGPARLAALQQQRDFDVQRQNILAQQYGIDLQRMAQGNQAKLNAGQLGNQASLDMANFRNNAALANRGAEEKVFGINADAINANNQSALNQFSAKLQAAGLNQDLLKQLGSGLIATAPQIQGNFTVDDMKKLSQHPEYLNPSIFAGGGLLSDAQIAQMKGSGPQAAALQTPTTQGTNNIYNAPNGNKYYRTPQGSLVPIQ